jgi:HSP20 family protein
MTTQESTSVPMVTLVPRVDIYENAEELLVLVDVPGAKADTIEMRLEHGELGVKAVRAANGNSEPSQYERTFVVPKTVDGGRVAAELKHGVLEIHLPKREELKPRSIQVRATA